MTFNVNVMDLRRACDAGLDGKDHPLTRGVVGNVLGVLRSRSNKAHVSQKNVDKLRKFINLQSSQNQSCFCDTWIVAVCKFGTALVRSINHGSELEYLEKLPILADPYSAIKYWSFRIDLNGKCNKRGDKRNQDETDERHYYVDETLHPNHPCAGRSTSSANSILLSSISEIITNHVNKSIGYRSSLALSQVISTSWNLGIRDKDKAEVTPGSFYLENRIL